MCGIAGTFGRGAHDDGLQRMSDALHHRGPDDRGTWLDADAGIGLAFARLAIIDLTDTGHQPMVSQDGRYVIAFNGEIYNFAALRERLHRRRWRGRSDTEVLLAAFEEWGVVRTLRETVGMFAFAVWDRQTRALTLARDRMGEKPLYFGWAHETLLFASELKAMRAYEGFDPPVDRDALAAFLRYGYVPSPLSIYSGVRKLSPGMFVSFEHAAQRDARPVLYWSLLEVAADGVRRPLIGTAREAVAELERRLSESISLQRVADVPLGAFLSGGVDSSTIVALMQQQCTQPVQTFTIGFDQAGYDEARRAKKVAEHLGTRHTELYVTAEEMRAVIPKLPTLYDEPFADSSQVPTFLVAQLARRHVTVSLSGDGGDELFGGYNRYRWARPSLAVPPAARALLARIMTAVAPETWDRVYSLVEPIVPRSLRMQLVGDKLHKLANVWSACTRAPLYQGLMSLWPDPDDVVLGGSDPLDLTALWESTAPLGAREQRMMAVDAVTYLPDDILCKVDRAAMAVSLETRMPFLDHRVVELAWRLPLHLKIRKGQTKWILRQLLYRHVPKELIERPKMGFGVPIGEWLRGPLKAWASAMLSETRLKREGYLRPAAITRKWREHLAGTRNWQYQIWTVLMFQAWLESEQARRGNAAARRRPAEAEGC